MDMAGTGQCPGIFYFARESGDNRVQLPIFNSGDDGAGNRGVAGDEEGGEGGMAGEFNSGECGGGAAAVGF